MSPRLEGTDRLTKRVVAYPGVVAAAQPTSMTWLPLAIALHPAGAGLALVGNRHAGPLRGALSGNNKSDIIDGEMLSRARDFFELPPARISEATELALPALLSAAKKAVVEGDRNFRRLLSLARWPTRTCGAPLLARRAPPRSVCSGGPTSAHSAGRGRP